MKTKIILLSLVVLFLNSCKKDKPEIPLLFTGEIVSISKDGATFTGNFKNIDPDLTKEFGFVWGTTYDVTLRTGFRHSLPLPVDKEIYSYTNNSTLMPDSTYYVRAYAVYPELTYYGKAISFKSLGSKTPEITAVDKDSAYFGDTLTISGLYFGLDASVLSVKVNTTTTKIVSSCDTNIIIKLPDLESYLTNALRIKVLKYNIPSEEKRITLRNPLIASISKSSFNQNELITIKGKGFNANNSTIVLQDFGNAKITQISNNSISFTPLFLNESFSTNLYINNEGLVSNTVPVSSNAPEITKVSPNPLFSREFVTLKGKNLEVNGISIFMGGFEATIQKVYNDSVKILVPDISCSNNSSITLRVLDKTKTFNNLYQLKTISNIQVTSSDPFYGQKITIQADYVPGSIPDNRTYYYGSNVLFNGESYYTDVSIKTYETNHSYINFILPANVELPNGKLDLSIKFCENTYFEVKDLINIPPPILDEPNNEILTVLGSSLKGENINPVGSYNKIYIDDQFTVSGGSSSTNTSLLFEKLSVNISEGQHQLYITTNGQKSNTIKVNVKHIWEKVAAYPDGITEGPVAFFTNNKFYIGGGENQENQTFYSYNLETGSWLNLSSMPTNTGLCVNDDQYGYVNRIDQLYRYEFATDTWSTLPAIEEHPLPDDIGYPGFLYDNKFYVFSPNLKYNHYFDIAENTWHTLYLGGSYSYTLPTVGGIIDDKAYFFQSSHSNYSYNFTTNEFSNLNSGYYPANKKISVQGITYNKEIYFFNSDYFRIHDIDTYNYNMDYRYIPGIYLGSRPLIFLANDKIYLLGGDAIYVYYLNR